MLLKDYRRIISLKKGEKMQIPAVIDAIEDKETKNGDPYVRIRFSDSFNCAEGNFFNYKGRSITQEFLKDNGVLPGMLVMLTIEKTPDKGYINVTDISKTVDPDVSLKDFAHIADGSADERFDEIIRLLKEAGEERKYTCGGEESPISEMAIQLYKDNEERIKWSAAAEVMHSEKAGGLLEHTEAMVRHAVKLCEVYKDLDKELLVTAAALHDIGKIEELETDELGRASYTPSGIGIGHIVIGYSYIDRIVQKDPNKYPLERVFLLESLILSHHGTKEYGSPTEPIVKEAFMLYFIDEMDAKYQEMKKGTESVEPGTLSDSKPMGIKHRIYNPKGDE